MIQEQAPSVFNQFLNEVASYCRKLGFEGEVTRHAPMSKDATYPAIVGRMMNRVPKKGGVTQMGARAFHPTPHPDRPGDFEQTYIREFDVIVQFQIHATTAEEADGLTQALEELLEEKDYFSQTGVTNLHFIEQEEDEVETRISSNPIAIRKINYFFTMTQQRRKVVSDLKRAQVRGNIR